jgi:hypothetical protein
MTLVIKIKGERHCHWTFGLLDTATTHMSYVYVRLVLVIGVLL